jgi:ribulose-phosphate 3-epimerase
VKVRIAPSLLSADFARLAAEIAEVEEAGADLIHLDVMDGHFVPNLTFGPPIVRALAPHCRVPLDAHLMVTEPDPLVPELAAAGVARVAIHVETCRHLNRSLAAIREHGMAPGVAINPATSLALLEEALSWVEYVLVMSVNPGFGGQAFIPESLDKIRRLRRMDGADRLDVAVDGGVDPTTAGALVAAGATTLIAGSAIFGTPDRGRAISAMRNAALQEMQR